MNAERVYKYKVMPSWGIKNIRVVRVACIKVGKTLYAPLTKVPKYKMPTLFDTELEAINARIAELQKQVKEFKSDYQQYSEDCAKGINTLITLKKSKK